MPPFLPRPGEQRRASLPADSSHFVYQRHHPAHGWFAGYRDDIAFATLVLEGSTSQTAVDVTGTFLGALGG